MRNTGTRDRVDAVTPAWGRMRTIWPTPLALCAIVAGVALHAFFFFFIRIEFPEESAVPQPRAFVQFFGDGENARDRLFREQALLFDSAPLFLPSQWNAAGALQNPVDYPEQRLFGDFPESLRLLGEAVDSFVPASDADRKIEPEDTLTEPRWAVFSSFGRRDLSDGAGPLVAGATLVVHSLETGRAVHREPLPDSVLALFDHALWRPAVFQILVEGGRITGEPLLAQSTGIEEYDTAIRTYLYRPFFAAELRRGYYRVTVAP